MGKWRGVPILNVPNRLINNLNNTAPIPIISNREGAYLERLIIPNEPIQKGTLLMANNHASDQIEAAINEAMKADEGHDDDDLLVEWVVVAYVTNPDASKGEGYPILFSNGSMPTHTARGLLFTALLKI
jgi:hypothetical protein